MLRWIGRNIVSTKISATFRLTRFIRTFGYFEEIRSFNNYDHIPFLLLLAAQAIEFDIEIELRLSEKMIAAKLPKNIYLKYNVHISKAPKAETRKPSDTRLFRCYRI